MTRKKERNLFRLLTRPDTTLRDLAGAAYDAGSKLTFHIRPKRPRSGALAIPESFDRSQKR